MSAAVAEPKRVQRPVSRTAYYCAGTRMLDARRPDPLVGDTYAERFMGDEGKAVFKEFSHLSVPIGAHQVRCYLIDELMRARLAEASNLLVVLIGAGFDSRAFRLKGGRWIEIDDRGVIERKESIAPSESCPNRLERVAIDFERDSLADKLAPFATDQPTAVICEGVTMYLEPHEIEALAAALKASFPRHWLIADLMTKRFAERDARTTSRALAAVGTGFRGLEAKPLERLQRCGYRPSYSESLLDRSIAMRRVPIPRIVGQLLWMFPLMRDGYRVVMLEFEGAK
jgi:methyltransferase (TIGR00027 family)